MATLIERDAGVLGALAEVFPTWQGEGIHVGRRHLFVRLAGCDVGCRFCDTPSALRRPARFVVRSAGGEATHDNPIDAARAASLVLDVARSDGPFHRLAVTGGEPLEQPAFLADLLRRLVDGGAPPVLLETAGTEPDALAEVIGSVATVSMDVKLPSVAAT
ncbi:MAG: radical SAM protein, partial [Planctomycetota bacterium JB042]